MITKKTFSNELVKGGISLFIFLNIFNALNFFYQFLMARMLGPSDYSTLAVLSTILYFIAIPSDSIQTIVTKYVSKFNASGENSKTGYFLGKALRKGTMISLLIFIVLMPIMILVFSYYLKISFLLVLLTWANVTIIFLIPVLRGAMQGLKKFNSLGFNLVAEGGLRLVIAVCLVTLGFGVYGAVIGAISSAFVAMLIAFIPLGYIFSLKKERADISDIYKNSYPIIFTLVAIMLFQSIDVILAKKFFSDVMAGQYAVANLVGKMVFFGTLAISRAMFPISVERFEKNGNTSSIMKKSIIAAIILCALSILFLWIFPEPFLRVFFGVDYLEASNILVLSGIAFSFLSISNIILLYGISINRALKPAYVVFFLIFQICLLYLFRASLVLFATGMVVSSLFLLIMSVIAVRKRS
ncbi:oligosaccharide flippase family protein [Candidatus Pacearchaeota archaeon]|nr:oligosaccharide flippase family protein [Candidatus Pacearchaeota archaeon]